jgi:hypothetical protein
MISSTGAGRGPAETGAGPLPVQFFRAAAMLGYFNENVFLSLQQILQQFD